jgi:hypothetical protein
VGVASKRPVLLVVRVEADDQALQRMRDIVTRDLDRFSRHDVTVAWPFAEADVMEDAAEKHRN